MSAGRSLTTTRRWTAGNRVRLLENGEAFYPHVFAAMSSARHEIRVETFIVEDDRVGRALHAALAGAAQRGVSVTLTVDGYGSAMLPEPYIASLRDAGVRFVMYDPRPRVFGMRLNFLRRLHRKLVVIDGRLAFVGGLNFSCDHLCDAGLEAKQDYAVEVEGPVVADIRRLVDDHGRQPIVPAPAGDAEVLLSVRDNHRHRKDIERDYRTAIRGARHDITIANAYFLPERSLLRELGQAAQRGVRVRILVQGQPDKMIVKWATESLYDPLLARGVRIFEYNEKALHGKVALVDAEWSTVGSSNLDPLSLSLNLEANLNIRDRGFARGLHGRLERLFREHSHEVCADSGHRAPLRRSVSAASYWALRQFPALATTADALAQPRGSIGGLLALLVIAFFAPTIAEQLAAIDWVAVGAAMRGYAGGTLGLAALLTLGSFGFYSCFDLVGRAWTRHRISVHRVMAIAFVSYAANLNLGSLLGSFGMRFHLYSRMGLKKAQIARILAASMATNWLGYLALAGAVLAMDAAPPAAAEHLGSGTLQAVGLAMLAVPSGYLAFCAASRRRNIRVLGQDLRLPSARLALAQLTLSSLHWLLMAAVVFVLMNHLVSFREVLGTLLLSACAALIAHIPAGVGVIEAVFVTLLGSQVPVPSLLAALLAYRAIYYLGPLLVGAAMYLVLRGRKKTATKSPTPEGPPGAARTRTVP